MIGLIADEFAVFIAGEGNAEVDKLHKAACAACRFRERDTCVDATARAEIPCHFSHAVRHAGGEGKLVIRLLIAARVA